MLSIFTMSCLLLKMVCIIYSLQGYSNVSCVVCGKKMFAMYFNVATILHTEGNLNTLLMLTVEY